MNYKLKILSKIQIPCVILILIILFVAVIRVSLLDVPLQRDEGGYAYTGQLILQGIPPYLQSFGMRPPGLYVAYAIILAVFGQTHQGIHFGLLVINVFTIVFIYLLAKRFLSEVGALISSATFAILSVSYSVQGIHANSEHFLILFAVSGLYLFLVGLKNNKL